MHNIAEGFDSGSHLEFVRFFGYAKRLCTEIQSQLYIALDQGYVSAETFNTMYEMAETNRGKIAGFVKYLLEFEKKRKASRKSEKP